MADAKPISAKRLADKVEWEGGVLAALEYGIRSEQIDDSELRSLWSDLEQRYRSLTPLVSQIGERLDQVRAA